jgi:Leucine-rich repeat (LRR) protein
MEHKMTRMVDDFDDAASDAELGTEEAELLAPVEVEEERCWWNAVVYPCSDVAASHARIKMRNRELVKFPRSVVFGVANVGHITVLDLAFNRIDTFPAWLEQLSGLRELILSHNAITRVDPCIYEMHSLRTLALDHNKIHYFYRDILKVNMEDVSRFPPVDVLYFI